MRSGRQEGRETSSLWFSLRSRGEDLAFQWHITEACDQRCKHCYIYALGSHAKFREMALQDMVTVIENCVGFVDAVQI